MPLREIVVAGGVLLLAGKAIAASGLSLDPVVLLDDAAAEGGNGGVVWNLGSRDSISVNHVTLGGSVLFDTIKVFRGGLNTREWSESYLLDVHAIADLDAMVHVPGAMAFADFQSHDQAGNGDTAVGDIQGFDTITAPRYTQIAQLWLKLALGDRLRIKVGKIDGNADAAKAGDDANDAFSLIEHSLDSLSAPPTYPPSVFALPTYPEPAPGVEVFAGKEIYAGAGAFYTNEHQTFLVFSNHPEKVSAAAGGMFFIGEVGARWTWGDLPGHAAVGGWAHTGVFPRTDGTGTSRGAGGGYAFLDQSLIHVEGDGARDLGFFINAGISDKTTSPMDQTISAGMTATGFVPGRAADSMGVMTSWAHLPAQPGLRHSFELASEVYYKLQITPWASVRPAFQYINHPSGVLPDAAVVMVRAEIDF